MKYPKGQTVTLRATFKLIDGTLTNPSNVMLTIEAPDGTQTTPTPTNVSTGVYEHELTLTLAGWYSFRFSGETTEGTAVCEDKVCAVASSLVGV